MFAPITDESSGNTEEKSGKKILRFFLLFCFKNENERKRETDKK